MIWVAPSEKDTANAALEKRLWDTAEQAEPASHLAMAEYDFARPEGLLGLIFLRFAARRAKLEKAGASTRHGSRLNHTAAYHADGRVYS